MKKRILAFGFEPFGRWSRNTSQVLVRSLKGLPGVRLDAAILPVSYARMFPKAARRIRSFRPAAVAAFGQAPGAVFRVERFGRPMRRKGLRPDEDGRLPKGARWFRGSRLKTRLPAAGLVRALRRAGARARLSDDAGNYLCNHLYHRLLRMSRGRFPVVFIHVPAGCRKAVLRRAGRAVLRTVADFAEP